MRLVVNNRINGVLSGRRQASNFSRFSAKLLDLAMALAFFLIGRAIWGPLGLLLALLWVSFGDWLGTGQSVGKKIFGLRVVEHGTSIPCSIQSAVIRNLPFVLGVIFLTRPILWSLAIGIAAPLIAVECYLLIHLESGSRLWDVMANTSVVDALEGQVHT